MTVHLIKLCVGCDTVEELAVWQAERLKRLKRARKTSELCHRTLQTPRRRDEILDGGSLYWVIKGFVLVRQRVLDLRPDVKEDGTACCGIVLDKELVTTRAHPRRAFQGWRYLKATDAQRDAGVVDSAVEGMPPGMHEELRELRLIDW
jgi:hypothetical protein